jgi:hypothetical protein
MAVRAMRVLVFLLQVLWLGGCAGLFQSPTERVHAQAREGQFLPVPAVDGPVKAWLRISPAPEADVPLTVYIEGDGAEWRGRYRPPADPTPTNALTLRLALRDPGARVAYLGRPCQYLDEEALAECPSSFWILGRYGEAALTIVDAAIDKLMITARAAHVNLVGFSGGGVIATLLAARRNDVACVVTLASPLDTTAWTRELGVSALTDSFNPVDFAGRLRFVAQWHFAAAKDEIVPLTALRQVGEVLPYARIVMMKEYDHDCCWVLAWEKLRAQTCLAGP